MRIQAGYEISYDCAQPTPMLLMLRVHPSRQADLESPERISFDPPVRATEYRDGFGNLCTRITAPPGRITISNEFIVRDGGEPDLVVPEAEQHALEDLPDHVLVFLLGSRYCDTDRLRPLHEHPGALLHRLSRRHRSPAGPGTDGLQRLVRGLPVGPVVSLRCP